MKYNTITFFFILYALTFSIGVFSKELLGLEQLVYNSLAENLTAEQINVTISDSQQWEWVGYVAFPFLLCVKILLISTALFIGIFLSEHKIRFGELFGLVTKAEFIFLPATVFKTVKFYFFEKSYSLADVTNYMPLSLESLFGYKNFEPWYIYPMQVANLFEVAYWIILTLLLSKALQIEKAKAFTLVAGSYGIGLLLVVVGVMFLTLNFTQ
jgi:hypothetical protein